MAAPFLSSEEYDERAHRYYSQGNYDRAVEVLREGLALYPSATELHVGLGYAYLAREDYAWARQSFERALVLDSYQEDALVGLGETLLKLGDRQTALRAFQRVLELGVRDDAEMLISIGRALFREDLYQRAEQFFRVAARMQPDSGEAAAAVGFALYRQGHERRAVRWLRRALDLDPECHEARVYLANLFYERGDWELALEQLEAVPAAEHWEASIVRRVLELKRAVRGLSDRHASLAPYRRRLRELEGDADPLDLLLAEAAAVAERIAAGRDQLDLFDASPRAPALIDQQVHRVFTPDGRCYVGRWWAIVAAMRDDVAPALSLREYMRRDADRWERVTGEWIPTETARAFLEAADRAGVLELDP
jgi:Flp pilus assembly protein TadD